MTTASSCPDAARLQELVDGTLAPADENSLIGHLDVCASCRQVLEALAGEGPAPDGGGEASEPDLALEAVVARLQEQGDPPDAPLAAVEGNDESLPFLSPPAQPGHLGRLEHYEILAIIGRGGMGVVLKAWDESLHRIVAIKVMAPQLAASATARHRFLREARATASVRDDHVIDIHGVAEVNGLPYIVMEYIEGISLQERLDQTGPVELREVLRIGMQIARGLAAAHAQGLVHRDVKPANILLENGVERVKLTDFGLARAADDANLTQSGVVAGTPQFMSPEQARGEAVDHRADLFSLGSVLYVLCAGRTPFPASNALAVLKRIGEDTPRPLREINPEIPDWMAEIISRLHAKNPADRFQTAAEVADLLESYLAHGRQLPGPSRRPLPTPPSGKTWVRTAHFAAAGTCLIGFTGVGINHLVQPSRGPKEPALHAVAAPRYALQFNGVNSRVDLPTLTYDGSHPLTIELWATLPQKQNGVADLIGNDALAMGIDAEDRWNGWVRDLPGESLESRRFLWSDAPYAVGRPTHLAVVLDGRSWQFFVDGRLQSVRPVLRGDHVPSNQGFVLAVHRTPEGEPRSSFSGLLRELRVSRTARYHADFVPLLRFQPDDNTLALYHFDEGQGSVLNDSSGNGHHGRIVGAKWARLEGNSWQAVEPEGLEPHEQGPEGLATAQQVAAIVARLQVLNPGFDGKVKHVAQQGVVTQLEFCTDFVSDIAPLAALSELTILDCRGSAKGKGRLANLTPLRGLKLIVLNCPFNPIQDLTPLRDLPLTHVNLYGCPVADLSPLAGKSLLALSVSGQQIRDVSLVRGMPLELLHIPESSVSDLAPLKGLPLKFLHIYHTPVSDLSPLAGMPLELLWCRGCPLQDISPLRMLPLKEIDLDLQTREQAEVLRSIPTLREINGQEASAFWKAFDRK